MHRISLDTSIAAAVLILTAALVSGLGCSLVFVTPPPEDGSKEVRCTRSSVAPVIDSVGTAYGVTGFLVGFVGVTRPASGSQWDSFGKGMSWPLLVAGLTGAIFHGASAWYGFSATARCRTRYREVGAFGGAFEARTIEAHIGVIRKLQGGDAILVLNKGASSGISERCSIESIGAEKPHPHPAIVSVRTDETEVRVRTAPACATGGECYAELRCAVSVAP